MSIFERKKTSFKYFLKNILLQIFLLYCLILQMQKREGEGERGKEGERERERYLCQLFLLNNFFLFIFLLFHSICFLSLNSFVDLLFQLFCIFPFHQLFKGFSDSLTYALTLMTKRQIFYAFFELIWSTVKCSFLLIYNYGKPYKN